MPVPGAGVSPARSCGVSRVWKQASSSTGWMWWSAAPPPITAGGVIRASTSSAPIQTSSMAWNAGPY